MKTKKIQPRVLIGNVSKLDKLAEERGCTRSEFMEVVSTHRIIPLSKDILFLLKGFGFELPIKIEDIKIPKMIEITNWNTKRYSVEVSAETEELLYKQAYKMGINSIGILLDILCANQILLVDQKIENIFGLINGGKNGR